MKSWPSNDQLCFGIATWAWYVGFLREFFIAWIVERFVWCAFRYLISRRRPMLEPAQEHRDDDVQAELIRYFGPTQPVEITVPMQPPIGVELDQRGWPTGRVLQQQPNGTWGVLC